MNKEFIEFHSTILSNLEFLRKRKGLSLEATGKKLELSKSGYRKIEKGESQISLRQLHTLSLIYEVSLRNLIFDDLQKPILNE